MPEPQLVQVPEEEWLTRIAALTWRDRESWGYTRIQSLLSFTWTEEGIATVYERQYQKQPQEDGQPAEGDSHT